MGNIILSFFCGFGGFFKEFCSYNTGHLQMTMDGQNTRNLVTPIQTHHSNMWPWCHRCICETNICSNQIIQNLHISLKEFSNTLLHYSCFVVLPTNVIAGSVIWGNRKRNFTFSISLYLFAFPPKLSMCWSTQILKMEVNVNLTFPSPCTIPFPPPPQKRNFISW